MGLRAGRELPSFPEEIILELTLAKGYGLEPGCSCVYVCMHVNVACMCIHGCVLGGHEFQQRASLGEATEALEGWAQRGAALSCLPPTSLATMTLAS